MNSFLKVIYQVSLGVLLLLKSLFLYFIFDRYWFHPKRKGISPVDIQMIVTYVLFPLALVVVILKLVKVKTRKQ